MLNIGLTTFAENLEPSRSECHAWSVSPGYDFLATICGIMPGSAGFPTVNIQPVLGELTAVDGSMPHPLGNIIVSLKRKGIKGVTGKVILPVGLGGNLFGTGKRLHLKVENKLLRSISKMKKFLFLATSLRTS